MKVLIIYHSGVGNTKLLSTLIYNHLVKKNECDLYAIESVPEALDFNTYDAYVIGFPTFHSQPSYDIVNYFDSIGPISQKKPAFIFTTCGWYSANTLRTISKICFTKGIIPLMTRSYKCIATDGVLIAAPLKILFDFDKRLTNKLKRDVCDFSEGIENKRLVGKLPSTKIYSIINYPNAFFGQRYTFKINLIKDKCSQCGRCVRNCNLLAYSINSDGYPEFDRSKCVNCYRCIHHCPMGALSLHKGRSPSLLLNDKFYRMKEEAFLEKYNS